jgi:predicted phage-related endonuclease
MSLLCQEYSSRSTWLAARRHTVGGSEAPVVMGMNKWKSPFTLWAEKVHVLEHPPREDQDESMRIGQQLEDTVRQMYCAHTERMLDYPGPYVIYFSKKVDFAHVSVDAFIRKCGPQPRGVFEAKVTGAWAKSEWDGEPPLMAQCQLQHGLMVTGFAWGSIAGLVAGWRWKFVTADFERNEKFIARLREKEEEFMYHVLHGTPPPVDSSRSTTDTLQLLYPQENGKVVPLGQDALDLHEALERTKRELKDLQQQEAYLKNELKVRIGEGAVGVLPDGVTAYRWKSVHKDAYTVDPCDYRELRKIRFNGGDYAKQ